jgi:enoyl-CoA hydratase
LIQIVFEKSGEIIVMEKPVLFEAKDGIALITLNRPERRNSINRDLLVYLYNYIEEVSSRDDIKVAVITGNGKSFCSGIDLAVIGKENIFDPRGDGHDLPDIIGACRKPVIAAVNGHAITGGFEIALNCDFMIASENAVFADTHAKVGIHPGWGMTQLLQQAVGIRMAKQMSLSCRFVDAAEALRIGLVNEVVTHENLLSRVMEICGEIVSTQYGMMMTIKSLIEKRNDTNLNSSYEFERREFRKFVEEKLRVLES